ncbi:MAG: hypothetical protein U1E76_07020 [Planctomycetota bacterium]
MSNAMNIACLSVRRLRPVLLVLPLLVFDSACTMTSEGAPGQPGIERREDHFTSRSNPRQEAEITRTRGSGFACVSWYQRY